MASLYFPQLISGASAQYPIRKTRVIRTLKNVLADGSMLVAADPQSAKFYWQLNYVDLSLADTRALQAHFDACAGPVRAFTFIDPTDNMLVSSSDMTAAAWSIPATIGLQSGVADPAGGMQAFVFMNNTGVTQEISQAVMVPANYQYCFSIYASTNEAATVTLARRGVVSEQLTTCPLSPGWSRIISTGRLTDVGANLTVAVSLSGGQMVSLYGPQLEAQIAPARYRPTFQTGGVYANSHWAVEELLITAEAPNLFATSFTIEASL